MALPVEVLRDTGKLPDIPNLSEFPDIAAGVPARSFLLAVVPENPSQLIPLTLRGRKGVSLIF